MADSAYKITQFPHAPPCSSLDARGRLPRRFSDRPVSSVLPAAGFAAVPAARTSMAARVAASKMSSTPSQRSAEHSL